MCLLVDADGVAFRSLIPTASFMCRFGVWCGWQMFGGGGGGGLAHTDCCRCWLLLDAARRARVVAIKSSSLSR